MKGLYDKNGNIFNFNPNYLDRGSTGVVYKISDDICLKKFYDYSLEHFILSTDVLEFINKLNLSHVYEIYEFLYNINNNFAGYTMKYYHKEDMDMLTTDLSFILDSFTLINESVNVLGDNNVCLYDMNEGNIIINRSGMTLIDLDDSYFDYNKTKEEIIEVNREQLSILFKKIFYNSLKLYYGYDFVKLYNEYIIKKLFFEFGKHGIEYLYKELEGYKYMLDYVRKKTR